MRPSGHFKRRKPCFLRHRRRADGKSGSRYTISIKTEQGDESFFADNIADAMLDLLEGYRQKGIAVLDIKTDRGTLEQHFMELTGREQQ